jgi:thermitase
MTPRLESLAFQVEPRRGASPQVAARAALARALPGRRWALVPLNARAGEFEAVLLRPGEPITRVRPRRPARVSVATAWNMTYALREDPRVVYAEPLFELPNDQQYAPPGPGVRSGGGDNDPGTANEFEWSIDKLNVSTAWNRFPHPAPGRGIVVGHPDTGFTLHPEIAGPRLLASDGFDFEDEDPDAADTLSGGLLRHPGHGTSTASLIISNRGLPAGQAGPEFVSGTAPGASLVPLRTTRSVVLWSMSRLTRALRRAIELRVHVVSISLGGPVPSVALHNAVRDAEAEGIIVLCAAGNQVRFVVFPAAFDEVIAVAASRIDDQPWPGSCRGAAVDITAPGASVWRARTERRGTGQVFTVERGSGTSYAVAPTAGIAALWLSFHGRSTLVARYGKNRIAAVFKQLLQSTCRTPAHWDAADFGPGIADADALLSAPLPANAPAGGLRGVARRTVSRDDGPLDVLVHQLAPAPISGVVRALSGLLHVQERQLEAALHDVGAELVMRVGTDPGLRTRLREAAMAETGRGARGARRRAGTRVRIQGPSRHLRRYI